MEKVTSMFSGPVRKEACHWPTRKAGWAEAHAPSLLVPMPFLLTGVAALVAGIVLLALRPEVLTSYHYNQQIIAVTHLFVLGFGCSMVMGALYQLVPVVLETRLASERWARIQFFLHFAGWTGMVGAFWIWHMKAVALGGMVMALGTFLFIGNLSRTVARSSRGTVISAGVVSVLGWLGLTVLAGLLLAASKIWANSPFAPLAAMHAHAHAGLAGVFVLLIVTVSFQLIPLFALGELQSRRRAAGSLILLNAGLAGVVASILWQSALKPWFGAVVVAGLILFGWEVRAILKSRKRSVLDWGLKYLLTGLWMLAPLSVLGMVLAWPTLPLTERTGQLETVYGLVTVLGVVGLAILGMLYKIVPFLVWYRRYGPLIGRFKVPSLGDMYSRRLQGITYYGYVSGLLGLSLATAWSHEGGVRVSAGILVAALVVFMVNLGLILRHWIRPRGMVPLAPMVAVARTIG